MGTFEDLLRTTVVRVLNGTGYAISMEYVVTAYHIIKEKSRKDGLLPFEIYIGTEEAKSRVSLHCHNEESDIAILKALDPVITNVAPVLGEFKAGDKVLGIGYQGGSDELEPFFGRIEGRRGNYIKFSDTEIKPGLSGSPLLNERTGRVCGVVARSRDTRGLAAGGYATSVSILEPLDIDLETVRTTAFAEHFQWSALASSAFQCEMSGDVHHTNLFPFDDPIPIREALINPRFSVISNGAIDNPFSGGSFFETAIQILRDQRLLFVFGSYGSGKTVLSKELQLRLHASGWETSYASAHDLALYPDCLNEYSNSRKGQETDRLLVVDALDESYVLNPLDLKTESVLNSLLHTIRRGAHLLINSRLIPSEGQDQSMHSFMFLEDLALLVTDKLQLPQLRSIHLKLYDKRKLHEWLEHDFDRRKRLGLSVGSGILDTAILKRARNNLLYSCYNPLFAYIFSDRFYLEDDSFDDIYTTYKSFVDKTIQGKFAGEQKQGSRAIKEIRANYRTIIQEMAIALASENDLTFTQRDLSEWKIDGNLKRLVLPHAKVVSVIKEAAERAIDESLLNQLSDQQVRRNILSCYFFEECESGWRFRDNNVLFFFLAEVLLEDLVKGELIGDDQKPLTQMLPRFSRCTPVPIHPVAVRMWLSKLRRLDKGTRDDLDVKLVAGYRSGKFLGSVKQIEDSSNEFRLELYLTLALLHIHQQGFADIPEFFRELERLSKQLSIHDNRAFDVFRASIRYASVSDGEWRGHDLNGFNFSGSSLNNILFNQCQLHDVVITDLDASDVQVKLCQPVKVKGERLRGCISFLNCPQVEVDVKSPGNLAMEFVNCSYVKLNIATNKRAESGNIKLSFRNCDDIAKLFLKNLQITKLHIEGCKYHTININGSRVWYRIQESKCLSTKEWTENGKTTRSELSLEA